MKKDNQVKEVLNKEHYECECHADLMEVMTDTEEKTIYIRQIFYQGGFFKRIWDAIALIIHGNLTDTEIILYYPEAERLNKQLTKFLKEVKSEQSKPTKS